MKLRATPWIRDAGERVAKTFVGGFLSAVFISGINLSKGATQLSSLDKAAWAGIASVFSLVLSVGSKWAGSPNSASLVPTNLTVPPTPPTH